MPKNKEVTNKDGLKLFWGAIMAIIKPQNFVPYWIPIWSWMIFIFVISSRSSFNTGPFVFDPFWHLGVFGLLAFLVYRAFRHYRFSILDSYLICAFWSFGYGILDEIHQIFVPGRTFSVFDMLTDLVGILLFGLLVRLVSTFKNEKK
jgi:hypothetical protein